ncbi:MAG: hypothetical protein MJE77_09725 [Proteobacteria bacterium]|nr:hypothetical protein [Pseudomonadota bacterium]
MPNEFYRDFLPVRAADPSISQTPLFMEIKSNLKREQVRLLAEANVPGVQPGIESLSANLLKLLRKGVSPLMNVYCLKLMREYKVSPVWNVLLRIPGERAADYDEMAQLIPKIVHFQPPCGSAREIEMHRFSPYFEEGSHWATNRRPLPIYKLIYPEHCIDISRIAYFFEADWNDVLAASAYDEVRERVDEWRHAWREGVEPPSLICQVSGDGTLLITDTRCPVRGAGTWKLNERESMVYRKLRDPTRIAALHAELTPRIGTIEDIVDGFVENSLAIRESGRILGLATEKERPNEQYSGDFVGATRPGLTASASA